MWRLLKWLKIELQYDPTIPLLGVYLEKMKTLVRRDIRTLLFIAALFIIAKTLKQTKSPSTDERMNKWCICTMEYYSAIEKNEIMPFVATWIDLEIIVLSEVSQLKTNTIWYHLYVESKT